MKKTTSFLENQLEIAAKIANSWEFSKQLNAKSDENML